MFRVPSVLQALEYESFRPPLKKSSGKMKRPNLRLLYSTVTKQWKDSIFLSAVILKSVYLQPLKEMNYLKKKKKKKDDCLVSVEHLNTT